MSDTSPVSERNRMKFAEIEKAARRTHDPKNVELLNNLSMQILLGLDVFAWDGLLTIARLSPTLSVLLEKMETLESKGFSGVPFISSSKK